MKAIKLTQAPHITQDCADSEPYYLALIKDKDGIDYRVTWEITMLKEFKSICDGNDVHDRLDRLDHLCNGFRSICDDDDVCDWDDYKVMDEYGNEGDVIIVW